MVDDHKPDGPNKPPQSASPLPESPKKHSSVSNEREPAEPVSAAEIIAIIAWTALADLLIFRSLGFCGTAVFFALVPLIFSILQPNLIRKHSAILVVGLLAIVVVRLVWMGSTLAVFSAIALVVGLAMSAAGVTPLVLEGTSMAARCAIDGASRLSQYRLPRRIHQSAQTHSNALAFLIPAAALIVFGSIFVFANPNLFTWVSTELTWVSDIVLNFIQDISIFEVPFCIAALLIGTGLMRPTKPLPLIGTVSGALESQSGPTQTPATHSKWYPAFRNTLVTLIGLFAVYLVFEFATLWKREFPTGFYYAGYAHQGAAWLTFALALATALLSLIFRQSMLHDPRLGRVRNLAWIWSGLNFLLAVAVYNRLLIYVGYNGMTRMRTVGFFGITLVVIGFALVLYKIAKDRSFWWLIRAQLIALLLTVIAYSIFPVDYVSQGYNVSRVRSGYLHPSVMVAVKPISDEGFFPLLALVDSDDLIIREGVRAMLAQRMIDIESDPQQHWTQFQASRHQLAKTLHVNEERWKDFKNQVDRRNAIEEFKAYAMQWY